MSLLRFRYLMSSKHYFMFVTFLFLIGALVPVFSQEHKAYTLLVGLEKINDDAYAKKSKFYNKKATSGVGFDLLKMKYIAEANGHIIKSLINAEANRNQIINAITEIGNKVKKGDSFIFYFSGHGDVIKDESGDEISGFDQVMVAFDDYIIDDDIYLLLKRYFSLTDNIMIVDACHSSSSWKIASFLFDLKLGNTKVSRYINEASLQNQNKLLVGGNLDSISPIKESFNLIYFGATEDDNVAAGNINGGLMTYLLERIISNAMYNNTWNQYSYRRFANELSILLSNYSQNLQYHEVGSTCSNYVKNIPFKIY